MVITYHYPDCNVEWDQWTGQLGLFSAEGERMGIILPSAWNEADVEEILRNELGYVSQARTVRPAPYNLFPFP
jgi:hypothetical protein